MAWQGQNGAEFVLTSVWSGCNNAAGMCACVLLSELLFSPPPLLRSNFIISPHGGDWMGVWGGGDGGKE